MYVDKASLEARGLTQDDLIEVAWEDFETEEEVDNIVEIVDALTRLGSDGRIRSRIQLRYSDG